VLLRQGIVNELCLSISLLYLNLIQEFKEDSPLLMFKIKNIALNNHILVYRKINFLTDKNVKFINIYKNFVPILFNFFNSYFKFSLFLNLLNFLVRRGMNKSLYVSRNLQPDTCIFLKTLL